MKINTRLGSTLVLFLSIFLGSCGGGDNAPNPILPETTQTNNNQPVSRSIEGFGAKTSGGANGEICEVTTLIDSNNIGSLRYCIRNRNMNGSEYIPRKIIFSVGGEIQLLTDLFIDTPFLTIDGSTAPSPGITITKATINNGEMIITTSGPSSGHDIILKYLRFDGEWNFVEFIDNNSATLAIDGEDEANAVYNIVLDHLTIHRSTDAGPDFWGDIHDVTVQWCLIYDSLHPTTISHSGGIQPRKNFSFHHNIYAFNHERNPKIRGNAHDMDFRNNIVYGWKRFAGGYGIQLQDRNGVFPTRLNFINNYFYSNQATNLALYFATNPWPGDVYMQGNRFPANNINSTGTTATEIAISNEARIYTHRLVDLPTEMLPQVGTHYRTAREQDILDEIGTIIRNDPDI